MDRLICLEPSNVVPVRIEPVTKCYGELSLRNVMYTMPVAFRIQAMNRARYTIKPQSGIIAPLATLTIEIIYHLPPGFNLPDTFPHSEDSFLLHSVVVPGAAIKDSFDSVPNDWFTTRKKQVFIDSGIKIMFVGSPVLVQLVQQGSMDEIREVLEKSDPGWNAAACMDSQGRSLLHIAISQSRADIVQLLLEFLKEVEWENRSGYSALEAASANGEALIVELLLARKANTERSENSDLGPIHLALRGGHLEVLKLLLIKGANVDSLTKDGNTALHLAVEERRKDVVRLLLSNGARPDVRNARDGDTPLHIAAALGDEQMVKLLLLKGANKDIRNRGGKTGYDVAAENGHSRLFDALKLGDSLSVACRKGEVRTIQKVLENGAFINGRDQHGWSGLHRACFKGKVEVVRMLIDKGIEIDGRDEDGYTALHCAVEAGQTEVTELLVKRGADVEARTVKNVSPLQIAESLHFTGISRILIHGGASKEGMRRMMDVVSVDSELKNGKMVMESRGSLKKKSQRGRSMRGSFDRSMALAVL